MFVHKRNPLDPVGGAETPESVALNRRRFMKTAALAAGAGALGIGAFALWREFRATDEEVLRRGAVVPPEDADLATLYPAPRDDRFAYDRLETDEAAAARYTNFYEFSRRKSTWRYVDAFQTRPWSVSVEGHCRRPFRLNTDELLSRYRDALVERQYRHRCVETWAMAVPWTGIPLARILRDADPLASATHVQFDSFDRPAQAPGMAATPRFPWPYTEGLTIREAVNDLALLATGMYGHPLLKQHGAPIRLVVPWKYGYKSIKSVQRIVLTDREPATFWSTLDPAAYPFQSNVDPTVPRPWPQKEERMLGTSTRHATQLYNGYGEYVAHLYDV
jgi:sulfoxide reductase catalytic subunit YedY